jgi:hypothetical protein
MFSQSVLGSILNRAIAICRRSAKRHGKFPTACFTVFLVRCAFFLGALGQVDCLLGQDEDMFSDWSAQQWHAGESVNESYLQYETGHQISSHEQTGSRPYRTWRLNPFAFQQGIGDWLFMGGRPADPDSLGFPFTLFPWCWWDRVPKPDLYYPSSQQLGRHQGVGDPLIGESWRNRPWHGDFLIGGLFPDDLTADSTDSTNGTFTGVRLGWDFDHYWGTEFRFAESQPQLVGRTEQANFQFADVSVAYYPWGDSRIRPYTSLGVGINRIEYPSATGNSINETLLSVPVSIGSKYYLKRWISLRGEVTNNMAFGGTQLDAMFSWSVTGGVEFRFGGNHSRYYPYDSGFRIR